MIVCSFWTNEMYRRFGERLAKSCENFGIKHHIEPMPAPYEEWVKNCQYKPLFIRKMLHKFPTETIWWVDCDAEVRSKLPADSPMMIFHHVAARVEGKVLYGGTMIFQQSYATDEFLRLWKVECEHSPGMDDRVPFLEATKLIDFAHLPPEYDWCRRFDKGEPVIEQHMISRLTPEEREALLK